MGDIVCIKIGENEPSEYIRFSELSQHLDITEVLPRKRDGDGILLNRTMGWEADDHYLGINVDMSHLDDAEFLAMRGQLTQMWQEEGEPESVGPDLDSMPVDIPTNIIAKRLYFLDLPKAAPFISPGMVGQIVSKAATKRAIKPEVYRAIRDEGLTREQASAYKKQLEKGIKMMEVNRFDILVPFDDFASAVVNKETEQTLAEELGIG